MRLGCGMAVGVSKMVLCVVLGVLYFGIYLGRRVRGLFFFFSAEAEAQASNIYDGSYQ